MKPLNERSLWDVSKLMRDQKIQPRELLESCFKQINQREPDVKAFTALDEDHAFSQVSQIEKQQNINPLYGVPIGVKDIINTVDFPTTMGSPIYARHQPARDAAIVAQCRNAGTIIPGKTESTEFAFFAPGKTRNPHSLKHTPGGSSMGSAAAVADNMLPLSIGSQTAGSVIRPAAYCGVVGYKASHGAFSMEGICGLSQNLDSLGFFVREPQDLMLIREGLLHSSTPSEISEKPNRIGIVRTAHWSLAEAYQQNFLLSTADQLADKSCQIADVQIEPNDGLLTEAQATIMAFEASRSLSAEFAKHHDKLSSQIQKLIQDGIEIKFKDYCRAIKIAHEGQRSIQQLFKKYDLLLTLSATGEAPSGLDKTGDPIFNRVWTLLKVPCIALPLGRGPNQLPISVQLIGPHNQDDKLIGNATWIAENL